jgi:metal-responsive CopG/Arc/MetJ family transcriptional regulator
MMMEMYSIGSERNHLAILKSYLETETVLQYKMKMEMGLVFVLCRHVKMDVQEARVVCSLSQQESVACAAALAMRLYSHRLSNI